MGEYVFYLILYITINLFIVPASLVFYFSEALVPAESVLWVCSLWRWSGGALM